MGLIDTAPLTHMILSKNIDLFLFVFRIFCFLLSDLLFVQPACSERDIVVTISVWCMCVCVRCACMRPSGFVGTITYTFMHGF